MARRAPNPNTAYGRKRIRQEIYQHKASLSPEERAKENTNEGCLFFIILGLVALIIFIFGGLGALAKWFSH